MLPTDQPELLKLMDNCSTSNAEENDFTSNQLLRFAAPVLAEPVTYLNNRCLSEVVFLNVFKTAKVLAI